MVPASPGAAPTVSRLPVPFPRSLNQPAWPLASGVGHPASDTAQPDTTPRDLRQDRLGLERRIDRPPRDYLKRANLANLYRQKLERLQRIPGVSSTSMSDYTMLAGGSSISDFTVEGYAHQSSRRVCAPSGPGRAGALWSTGDCHRSREPPPPGCRSFGSGRAASGPERNQNSPEGDELEAPLGQMIVTRCGLVAPRA